MVDLWICKKAPGADKKLDYGYANKVSKIFFAKFAGHTASVAGKLSFKERDVSCYCIFDAF